MEKREYKFEHDFSILPVFGICIGLVNNQPKSRYKNADWQFGIMILCFTYTLNLTYKYNP